MFVQLFVFSTCLFTHTASSANTPMITASTKIALIVQRRLWRVLPGPATGAGASGSVGGSD